MDRCGAPHAPLRALPPQGDSGCPASPQLHPYQMKPIPTYKGDHAKHGGGGGHKLDVADAPSDQMFHGLSPANTGVSRTISPTYPRTLQLALHCTHRAAVERLATNEGGGGTGWWGSRSPSGGHCRLPWVSILHPGSGAAGGP